MSPHRLIITTFFPVIIFVFHYFKKIKSTSAAHYYTHELYIVSRWFKIENHKFCFCFKTTDFRAFSICLVQKHDGGRDHLCVYEIDKRVSKKETFGCEHAQRMSMDAHKLTRRKK